MEAEKFNEIKELFENYERLKAIKAFLDENSDGVCIFRGVKATEDSSTEMTEVAMPEALRTRFATAVTEALTEAEAAVTEA